MSIAKVVYTKVSYETGQPRPDIPIPQPDTTYEGPLHPPHATKWVARGSLPPLPSPQPIRQPRLPTPHGPSGLGNPWLLVLLVVVILCVVALVALPVLLAALPMILVVMVLVGLITAIFE
ncbi:hypothetical protein B0J17DRAFT_65523 [Rhizoctonia solani]|nr:hypothetical protein B0J17DRAFT_65523 [Rhizoctonia solani]